MAYEEKNKRAELAHHVILEGRQRLSVSGVEDVESFDETTIVAVTTRGALIVRGAGLHIEKLSLDNGELSVEGSVDSLTYDDEQKERAGFWSRLFK